MAKFKVSFEKIVEAENDYEVLPKLEEELAYQNKKIWSEMVIEEVN